MSSAPPVGLDTQHPVDATRKGSADDGPGSGHLHLSNSSQARFETLLASYPLKLLTPNPLYSQPTNVATAYTLAYGGGLVAGDTINLRVEVDAGCGLVMLTQGSTKVFKHRPGIRPRSQALRPNLHRSDLPAETAPTKQRLHVTLQSGAFLLLMPDSVSPFHGSRYSQTQRFRLPADRTASVLILDWVNSGRGQRPGSHGTPDHEEIWTMDSYASTNEILVGQDLVMRERMVLDNTTSPLEPSRASYHTVVAHRMAPYNVYATVLILGPHLQGLLRHLSGMADTTRQYQAQVPEKVVWAFSPVEADSSGVLRLAGEEVEDVRLWLRVALEAGGVKDMIGEGLWPRLI